MQVPGQFDHPAWKTAISTVVTYSIILLIMTALLFGVPYLFFSAL
jgi:hypothetical protein